MKGTGKRKHVRRPDDVEAFRSRVRIMFAKAGINPKPLSSATNFCPQLFSRLCRGKGQTLPIDLLVSLGDMADANGVNLRWLITGKGQPFTDDSANPFVRAEPAVARESTIRNRRSPQHDIYHRTAHNRS